MLELTVVCTLHCGQNQLLPQVTHKLPVELYLSVKNSLAVRGCP